MRRTRRTVRRKVRHELAAAIGVLLNSLAHRAWSKTVWRASGHEKTVRSAAAQPSVVSFCTGDGERESHVTHSCGGRLQLFRYRGCAGMAVVGHFRSSADARKRSALPKHRTNPRFPDHFAPRHKYLQIAHRLRPADLTIATGQHLDLSIDRRERVLSNATNRRLYRA